MIFARTYIAEPADIDELRHVNNAVWIRWAQDLATSHWDSAARAEDRAAFVWVVTRHEIDYRGNIGAGETVRGETWVAEPPTGARFDRRFRFLDSRGVTLVEGITTWAMIDRATGRLARIRTEVAAPFLAK